MELKKYLLVAVVLSLAMSMLSAQTSVLKLGITPITLILDGKIAGDEWRIMPEINPDKLRTIAHEVKFASDVDTLRIVLNEWETKEFHILTTQGDTAYVRVTRTVADPFENPSPQLKSVSPSGLFSREQAAFDIKALVYSLSEVHPDIFSICRQDDFFRAVNSAIASLPDSISPMELYRIAAPIVAMIGDGHTNLRFPYNSLVTADLKHMPLFVDVLTDRTLICTTSLDSIIPRGAKILGINGQTAEQMIDMMLPFVSGERSHFRLARLNDGDFTALHQMLFPANSYEVAFISQGAKKTETVTLPAILWDDMKKRCPFTKTARHVADYSFTVDSAASVAVMDFRSFNNIKGMEAFADSMFTKLRSLEIRNLIIDIRNNGGGNSSVGDVLLRYISPEPFVQMEKMLVRITPLTLKLMGGVQETPGIVFYEESPENYIKPRSVEEGHFQGHVYLLTANKTFSSAGSFAWAFKECGVGPVIGEETGGMNVSYGDILGYHLPISGLLCTVSFKRFWQLRADENDIHGTIPDISVPAAEAMEAVMKLVKKNNRKKK